MVSDRHDAGPPDTEASDVAHAQSDTKAARANDDPAAPDAGVSSGVPASELEDRWKRTAADLENLRKKCAREVEHMQTRERARVAHAWLAVVDDLERALEYAGDRDDPVVHGVRAIFEKSLDVLAGLGYQRDDEVGIAFDPARHNVVTVVELPDTASGTVVRVDHAGYSGPDHQLRPAKVVVARSPG